MRALSLTSFRSLPIRIKLLVLVVGICAGALLLSAVLETILNWTGEGKIALNRLAVTAEMLSLQSRPALEFLDHHAAYEDLHSLKADPVIQLACLYDEAGAVFTFYSLGNDTENAASSNSLCPPVKPESHRVSWNSVEVFHGIEHNNHKAGSIYLKRALTDVHRRFVEQVGYKLVIILLVIALAWSFSSYFQRMISHPIVELAAITRRFSTDRTQQVRAVKAGDDEIGALVDAFNAMMEEIRQSELKLSHVITELTRSNTELERFAHICSHDLQEPLRMISSYTALLEKHYKGKLDEESQEYMHFIMDGAAQMRQFINDILTYARIAHQAEPMQRINLTELVESVLQSLSATIRERGARIHTSQLPEITGNKTLLIQIFQNLVSNALKFSPVAPEIWIEAVRHPDAWEFSVKDNGIGIDLKYHEKIFEIFKRLNRREEFPGTGIGLAIFKKAVDYHKGKMRVRSELGKGTTFFFTIPDANKKEKQS